MEVDREKVNQMMLTYCNGNYNLFARELGMDPSHLYKFINFGVGGGKKLVGAIMKFCNAKGLNFEEYVKL